MDQSLYLAGHLVHGDPERLRAILADHTQSPAAAAELLLGLDRARRDGPVSHCLVYRGHDPAGDAWKVRVSYEHAVPA